MRTRIFVTEPRNCVRTLHISTFPTRIPMVQKDYGPSLRCPMRPLGCAKVATKGFQGRAKVATNGLQVAGRRARQSLRATQFRRPRWVHIENTSLSSSRAMVSALGKFNASDSSPDGTEGFWFQLVLSNAPSGPHRRDHKRAPDRKPTRWTIPPCYAVSPPAVGAHCEHTCLSSSRAIVSALCTFQRFRRVSRWYGKIMALACAV